MTPSELISAAALDERDALASFRDRFTPAEDGLVYLDGNSLGRLPAATPERMATVVGEWGERLIRGWDEGWMELPLTVGDRLGGELLGAGAGQVAVADSTTVCLYKLAAAALDARPERTEIVTDRDNFPTDRYVLEGLAQSRGLTVRWIEAAPDAGPRPADVAAVVGPKTALVALSHVAYRSAFLLDMAAITAVAHEAGALALWDLSHSAGVAPVELDASGADLATGCTYKYLNGGPGAPAFLYVRAEHQPALRQPIWGWLGRRDPFLMAPGYEPAVGIASFLSGTPPVLALNAVAAGIDLVCEAGIAALRAKSVALGEFVIARHDEWLAPRGVVLGSPRISAERGGHVALVHSQAAELCRALAARGVITDYRPPDIIRVGLAPLTTSFAEVERGLAVLRGLL
ncbi:MAG TPA: aminotransferase class V-fold PLP-dependent enzyme [Solirubrobacteraceae bacterium]